MFIYEQGQRLKQVIALLSSVRQTPHCKAETKPSYPIACPSTLLDLCSDPLNFRAPDLTTSFDVHCKI